jgi:hypothetical protein
MIIYSTKDVPQGSDAWLKIRLGVPTTSNFGKIITPTGKASAQSADYLNDLLGQLLAGKAEDMHKSSAMMRGNELEPVAVDYYQQHTGNTCKEVGFITTKDGRVGCSPDRLVGKDGLLEVKCPLYKQHVKNLRSGKIDMKYYPQVQGQLLLSRRNWCDFLSFHPDMPSSIVRVERDDEYIDKMKQYIIDFLDEMDEVIAMLQGRKCPFAIEVRKHNKLVET